MPLYLSNESSNPLMRILMAVVGAAALAGALVLGTVAFLVVLGLVLVLGIVFWLRMAWIRHRLRKQGIKDPAEQFRAQFEEQFGKAAKASKETTIEAEYTVVSRRQDP